ncbi:MAG: restriction endonuclease subunit S [Bacteroidaceae bacterium]|nr:restriction endonuclease subunit S [Bacteroidaceae bacterium]
MKLGKYIKEYSVRNKQLRDIPVYSVTNSVGLTRPEEYFNKTIHSEDLRNYKIVKRNMIAFNPVNIKIGSVVVQDAEDEVLVSPLYTVFEVDTTKLDPYYVVAFLRSPSGLQKVLSKTTGSVRIVLKYSGLCDIDIPMPSLAEQRHIVQCLNAVQESIDRASHRMVLYDKLVKSRFIELFGDPSSNPMRWKETTVGEECHYIKDGPHKSLPDVGEENGYPFISVRNIVNGYIDFSTAKYISKQDYLDSIKKCHPQKGDMLYSKGGTTGIAKLVDVDVEFANWVHVAVLKFDDSLNGIFFENMLNSDYCYDQSQKLTKGIANRDLVLSAMAQIKMYKPPLELQQQFAAFVEQTDKSKLATTETLKYLEELKAALMSQYFG